MPTSLIHAIPHWLADAGAWTLSFCLTLVRTPHPDSFDDLCQYGDAGAYRREMLPAAWRSPIRN